MKILSPIGPVRAYLHPPAASIIPSDVRVPPRVRLLDCDAWIFIPLPIQRFLQG